jgi:hypothetical protein
MQPKRDKLNTFWDDPILGSERFQSVRNTATALRLQPDHARAQLPELRETNSLNLSPFVEG